MLGEKIKQYRKENNITQKQLAELLGLGRSTVAEMESGKIKGKISNIKKLADITKKPLTYWTDGEDIDVVPYDVLDAYIEMLINSNIILNDGKVPEAFKDSLLAIIEKEIQLKLCRKKNK